MKDQWAIQGNDTMKELVDAINGPGRVLVVGDGWNPLPVCLTRVWCLFEILNTIQLGATLRFAVFSDSYKEFQDYDQRVRKNKKTKRLHRSNLLVRSDRFDRGAKAFPSAKDIDRLPIDVRKADATVEADKAMIFDLIEQSVGHDAVNAEVKKAIAEARSAAVAAETTERNYVWIQEVGWAGFINSLWLGLSILLWTVFCRLDRGQDGDKMVDSMIYVGTTTGMILTAVFGIAVWLPTVLNLLGVLKVTHALLLARHNAQRGVAVETVLAPADSATPGAFVIVSPRSPGGSRRASAPGDSAPDDDGAPASRTPSGREPLANRDNNNSAPGVFVL